MDTYKVNSRYNVYALIAGIIFGLLFLLLPVKIFAMIICVIAVFVIIRKIELGIFAAIGLAPFVPTMVLIGLIVSVLISFVLQVYVYKNIDVKFKPVDCIVLLFSATVIYGTIISFAAKSSSKISLVYILFILFYFIINNILNTKKRIYIAVVLMVTAAFIVALYGIYQNYAGIATTQSWIDEEMFKDIKLRVYSTFNNPNVLGEYLILLIPISFGMLWSVKNKGYKLIFAIITLTLFPCLIYTWARGSWIGAAAAMAVFAFLRDRKLLVIGIIVLIIMPFIMPESVIMRIQSVGNVEDTSTAYRVSIWLGSLKMIKDYWMTGIGLGSQAFGSVYPVYALSGAAYALHSHNLYLQIFAEMGIAGLISFLTLIFMFYKSLLSTFYRTKDKFLSTIAIAFISSMTGYLLQGLVDNIWYNYRLVFVFWCIYALGMTTSKLIYHQERGNIINDKSITCSK